MLQEHYRKGRAGLEESLQIFEKCGGATGDRNGMGELAICHLGVGSDQTALELLQKAGRCNTTPGSFTITK